MTKQFRMAGIFLTSVVGLLFARILFSCLPLSDNVGSWLFSFFFQTLFMGVIPYLLYRFTVDKQWLNFRLDFSLNVKINPLLYVLAVLIGIFTFYLNTGASAVWYVLLNQIGYTYTSSVGTIYSSPEVLVLEIITTCILPAVFEEVTDRGLLAGLFREEKNDKAVILLIGLSFGLWHQNVPQLIPTMVGGFVMAFMAIKCGSIVPGMIVHFLNNFIITMVGYSAQKGGGFYSFYNTMMNAFSQNILFLVLSWAVAGAVLSALLRTFEKLGRPERDRLYPTRPALLGKVTMYEIFGVGEPEFSLPVREAPAKREYALFYVALVVATLTTLFTLIWGLLR